VLPLRWCRQRSHLGGGARKKVGTKQEAGHTVRTEGFHNALVFLKKPHVGCKSRVHKKACGTTKQSDQKLPQ
jgi:hypothetical protein